MCLTLGSDTVLFVGGRIRVAGRGCTISYCQWCLRFDPESLWTVLRDSGSGRSRMLNLNHALLIFRNFLGF